MPTTTTSAAEFRMQNLERQIVGVESRVEIPRRQILHVEFGRRYPERCNHSQTDRGTSCLAKSTTERGRREIRVTLAQSRAALYRVKR